MFLKQEGTKLIRLAHISDFDEYMELFSETNFSLCGINSNQKPSNYQEAKYFKSVTLNNDKSCYIFILEDDGIFIGYADMRVDVGKRFHIGEFVIRKQYRKQGYSVFLLNTLKNIVANEDGIILLECFYGKDNFFKNNGFERIYDIHYKWISNTEHKDYSIAKIFLSDDEVREKNNLEMQKELDDSRKSLEWLFKIGFFTENSDNIDQKEK